ncbi:MAG: type II toxin-antitoxin system HicA family toxin [Proteobacteria bacterium]|nr:type II toxin-antitoxin system HicA family toxin [Pseudomonadota bacterium]
MLLDEGEPTSVATILEPLGFIQVRQKGSHRQFQHDDGRRTTIPFHMRLSILEKNR